MSESWENTRKSVRQLKNIWQNADEGTKYDIAFWGIGLTFIGLAIVAQFGMNGALFCIGIIFWRAGCVGLGLNGEK